MSEKKAKEARKGARIVKSVDERPCGCVITTFSDDAQQYAPCVACGLYAVAEHLAQAGQALASVATRIQGVKNQASMAEAVSKVIKP